MCFLCCLFRPPFLSCHSLLFPIHSGGSRESNQIVAISLPALRRCIIGDGGSTHDRSGDRTQGAGESLPSPQMKIASWKRRGFQSPLKQRGVGSLILVSLVSWRLDERTGILLRRFAHNFNLSAHGRVLWDTQQVEVEEREREFIDCRMGTPASSLSNLSVWASRQQTATLECIVSAWRDWNHGWFWVLTAEEKVGGVPLRRARALGEHGAQWDLQSIGCRFRWTNGTLSCKLDRAMVKWLLEEFRGWVPRLLIRSVILCGFSAARGSKTREAFQVLQHVDRGLPGHSSRCVGSPGTA